MTLIGTDAIDLFDFNAEPELVATSTRDGFAEHRTEKELDVFTVGSAVAVHIALLEHRFGCHLPLEQCGREARNVVDIDQPVEVAVGLTEVEFARAVVHRVAMGVAITIVQWVVRTFIARVGNLVAIGIDGLTGIGIDRTGIANVAEPVAIKIRLVEIRYLRTIVGCRIQHAVEVTVVLGTRQCRKVADHKDLKIERLLVEDQRFTSTSERAYASDISVKGEEIRIKEFRPVHKPVCNGNTMKKRVAVFTFTPVTSAAARAVDPTTNNSINFPCDLGLNRLRRSYIRPS